MTYHRALGTLRADVPLFPTDNKSARKQETARTDMPSFLIERGIPWFSVNGKTRYNLAGRTGNWGAVVALSALFLLILGGTPAFAREKVSAELRHHNSEKPVDVIVQFTSTPTDKHIAKVTGAGAALNHKLSVINGAAFKHLPASAVSQLAADPDVVYISPDREVRSSSSNLDYAPETVNAPWVWQQFQLPASGVGVAVIDSGISPVADLYWYDPLTGAYGLRIVYSQNFVDSTTDASDYFGHGTHVAGIIASAGWSSTGKNYSHTFKGIAPNANIINLRALDQTALVLTAA